MSSYLGEAAIFLTAFVNTSASPVDDVLSSSQLSARAGVVYTFGDAVERGCFSLAITSNFFICFG